MGDELQAVYDAAVAVSEKALGRAVAAAERKDGQNFEWWATIADDLSDAVVKLRSALNGLDYIQEPDL
jgi:hypothetical protein